MLAQCTVRPHGERALDLGTGCGVQAFHLATHVGQVVGTDISERCLQLASFNAAMNYITLDLRRGSLFDPVEGERFDLIVSNPPFVIGSPNGARHDYRDSGLDGDAVCASVVVGAAAHLAESGWCQLLANWEITDGDDWAAHPRSWVAATGLDAWIIQREVQDIASYIEMWLRDAGEQWSPAYRDLYDRWMSTLERRGVIGVGFGLISLRRSGRDRPVQRFQHAPQAWVQPVAPDVERWFAVHDILAADPAGVLMRPLQLGPDVVVERHRGAVAPEGVTILRRSTGMGWSGPIDTFGLDLLAQLDGDRPAAEAVLGAALQHEIAPEDALAAAVPVLGQLAVEGFVL
jgi:methylase of polypeptide subunit release factors